MPVVWPAWPAAARREKREAVARVEIGRGPAGDRHARADPGHRAFRRGWASSVVDEQHRFGVARRLALAWRQGWRRGAGPCQHRTPSRTSS
ncbi:hypothetical protein ACTMU2_33435 [Cupriavidus basilensis]